MDENINNIEQQQVAETAARVLIALTKTRGGKKILAESMAGYESGYTVDGIFIEKNGIARVFAINAPQAPFGINSHDLQPGSAHYDEIVPSLGGYSGQEMTQLLIDIYNLQDDNAAVLAQAYGWLPEAGEMDLVAENVEAFNALVESLGGTPVTSGKYWLAQRRNAAYAWFYDAAQNGYGSWVGGMSPLLVLPCKSADDWME